MVFGGGPNMLDGIAVTANIYEETKTILLARYGNTNRIIQAHLDFLEGLRPAKSATPDELHLSWSVIAASKRFGLWGKM